ncbi:signal peptidase complex subunit 2 [Halovivax gelatinilyticus]|uniref:signal peptidase complex subunit 2 n=1 Tax=Halovivax gelatinilyticus TaxID=2961597 RepID=UPI0020CA9946|nr:signal peptidase complex subunit 2 [Halovivax gelatinilyticus]
MSRPRASKEIGHEEFDPIGTLALIGLYFLILVMLWLFTYFVEFVGNEPTPMLLV